MIVSVDLGYGYVKSMSETYYSVIYPSLIAQGRSREMENIFGADDSNIESLHVEVGGEEFFVGELARRSGNATFTLDSEKISHRNTKVLLVTALGLLLPPGQESVYLATGLPYAEYSHQKESFINNFLGFKTEINFKGGPKKGFVQRIKITDILVFPQAAGAIYADMDKNYIFELANTNKLLSVVDVGYKTTDVVTFEAEKKFRLRQDMSGTIDAGAGDIEKRVNSAFTEKTGRRLDPALTSKLIKENGVFFRGKHIDLKNEIDVAKREIAQRIIDNVRLIWNDRADFIDNVLLAGGGSILLNDELKKIHYMTDSVFDEQFANCKGFLEVAKRKRK